MQNYVLVSEFGRANIPDSLYYVMSTDDLETLKAERNISFGTKAFAIKNKTTHIMGNDNTWYEI